MIIDKEEIKDFADGLEAEGMKDIYDMSEAAKFWDAAEAMRKAAEQLK